MFDGIKKVVETGAKELENTFDDASDNIADNAKKSRVKNPIYFIERKEEEK